MADTEDRIVQRGDIEIHVGRMDVFNCAMYQNGIRPIRGIQIANRTQDPIEGLSLVIMPETELFGKCSIDLPVILPGKPTRIEDPEFHINGKQLAELTEPVTVNVKLAVLYGEEFIAGGQGDMKILTYDQWMGEYYSDFLPSFVMPNHPVVSGLIHDAAMILQKWNESPAINGYQEDANRVIKLAAAAYAAIQKKNIVYATTKANIWIREGQRIRTPEIMIEQRLGNCMEMTLLYAACLEAMGLHPLLYTIEGHIFTGLWLHETYFKDLRITDNDEILKKCHKGTEEIIFIESTAMCAGKSHSFEEAELIPGETEALSPRVFDFALDVFTARLMKIQPLFSRTMKDGRYEIDVVERKEDEISAAPQNRNIVIQKDLNTGKRKISNKKELWETKLLDLSTHNMLLNLPYKTVEPILSAYVEELEDALADGEEFTLCHLPVDMVKSTVGIKEKNGKEKQVPLIAFMLEMNHGVYEMTDWQIGGEDFVDRWRQEARRHRLYTYRSPDELEKNLTAMYRAASASQQENGVSSLYMAVGLLRWIDPETGEPHYAPLVLVPIEMVRKSANQGYAFHMRDEEPHFNLTLLEMLKQNHNIDIGGLDPLPTDAHGVDIKRAFAIVRSHLQTVRNWDVIETCVIGNFSFAQFAMWNDIHRAGDMLDNSGIVRSLMKGHVDWDVDQSDDAGTEEIYLPITVDGTQLEAIRMAAQGKTFVLHGPPGTGKSQTITGMIANLMAHGKRVLFVAEKMAALSVVEKRLTSLGIGDFCLELHSDKANKKHVLTQLDKALVNQGRKKKDEYEAYLKKFNLSRAELDRYMQHLHQTRTCGYSLYELIDLYETTSEQDQTVPFSRDEVREMTNDQIRSHKSLIGKLTAAGDDVRDPLHHPLRSVELDNYSFAIRTKVEETVNAYLKAAEAMKAAAAQLAENCGRPVPDTTGGYGELLRYADCAVKVQDTGAAELWLTGGDSKKIRKYLEAHETVEKEKQEFLKSWKEEFLNADMAALIRRCEAAEKKLIGKGAAMKGIVSELQGMAKKTVSPEMVPIIAGKVKEWQERRKACQKLNDQLSAEEKETAVLVQTVSGLDEAKSQADALRQELLACKTELSELKGINVSDTALAQYRKAFETFFGRRNELNTILERHQESSPVEEEIAMAQYLQKTPSALKGWSIYVGCRNECLAAGLAPVIKAYEGGIPSDVVYPAYRKGLYYALINEVMSTDEVLSTFSGSSFNESVRQFKQLDDALIEHTKTEIFNKLVEQIPTNLSSAEAGIELNMLRKAIGSNARGMSIRALFEKLSHIIQKLCPVMLMSPNSVAQYLERKNDVFDVVIFDEASQLPTCKAVGALARAKAAVIVGDPKQMPPTSFFAADRQLTEDLSLDDLDSILDDALALGVPSQYLQWHYRSTHESLIAFSNYEFYGNKMFTFPSANDRERRVRAIRVNGVYKNSVNAKEAEAVVQEVIRRYQDPELKKLSIGIVTFNVKQMDVIYNLLNKQFQKNPDLDAWANNGEDPLFIKNLENVQGDERDVIMFSIGYGPDEKGSLSMNFGPINKTGGGKRLNVAFSRARVEMLIFTSMDSTQIKVNDTSPDGLKAFKEFLHYAEGNDLREPRKPMRDDGETGDGIMSRICSAIREKGYECQTNIGHSSFHVDIAVVDPYDPTQYLMGILLDGENYRMTGNTRDREIAQVSVLRRLGWTLLRVWTIDWWDNADKQLRIILEKLEEMRKAAELRNAEKERDKHLAPEAMTETAEKELAAEAEEVITEEETETQDLFKLDIPGLSVAIWAEKKPEAPAEPAPPEEPVQPDIPQEEPEIPEEMPEEPQAKEEPQPEPAEEPVAEEPAGPVQQPAEPVQEAADGDPRFVGDYRPIEYVYAEIPTTPIETEDYVAPTNRKEIIRRAEIIAKAEAPIYYSTLMWRTWATFGVKRQTNAVTEATEKALRAANIRNVKTKGVIFCWEKGMDPNAYKVFRIEPNRNCDEISPHELKNAICYTLKQHNGKMDRDDLIFAVSRNLGYKRLGKIVEATITAAIQFAKTQGVIEGSGQISLKGTEEAE